MVSRRRRPKVIRSASLVVEQGRAEVTIRGDRRHRDEADGCGRLIAEMSRRIVSMILALAVPCLMPMKPEATVCPAGPRDLTAIGSDEGSLHHHAVPSSPAGHKCCPPVARGQDGCKHATAGKPECGEKSVDCCLAKAPSGQLPPSKTIGPASSDRAGLTRVVFRTPEKREVWANALSPRAETGLQLNAILRI